MGISRKKYSELSGVSWGSEYTVEKKWTRTVSTPYNLFAVDEQGRALGVVIKTREITFVPAPKAARTGYTLLPGYYFALGTSLTRDGKAYHDIEEEVYATKAKRQAAIARHLMELRRLAKKIYGGSGKKRTTKK